MQVERGSCARVPAGLRTSGVRGPIRGLAVVVVKRTLAAPVMTYKVGLAREVRGVAQLAFRDVGPIAAEVSVVPKRRPGNGMALLTEPQEPADRDDGIDDPAARLFDDQALDRSDVAIVRAIDGRPLDAVALDEGPARARLICHDEGPPRWHRTNRAA